MDYKEIITNDNSINLSPKHIRDEIYESAKQDIEKIISKAEEKYILENTDLYSGRTLNGLSIEDEYSFERDYKIHSIVRKFDNLNVHVGGRYVAKMFSYNYNSGIREVVEKIVTINKIYIKNNKILLNSNTDNGYCYGCCDLDAMNLREIKENEII